MAVQICGILADTKIGGMAFTVERNPNPRDRGAASRDPRRARLRQVLHRPHGAHRLDRGRRGGATGRVVPYGPLTLDPATMALHYGQEIFEGLKAYRQPDGSIATFRPDANAARFAPLGAPARHARAARRSCSSSRCASWSRVDGAWVPTGADESLYLRPFMIATEVGLGRAPAGELHLPAHRLAGRRRTSRAGCKPVTVWLSTEYTRAAPGGTGEAKCARQLRGVAGRAGAGRRAGLRPGRLARRRRAPLGRGDGRDEPVLRVRLRPAARAS